MSNKEPTLLWPINRDRHPTERLDAFRSSEAYAERSSASLLRLQEIAQRAQMDIQALLQGEAEGRESANMKEFLEMCFSSPQIYRDMALTHAHVRPKEAFQGQSTFYAWLNKICPVGCDFCFFKSNPESNARSERTDITMEGIGRLNQYLHDGNFDKLVITGGGEPMMKRREVMTLLREAPVKRIIVVTSSYFSVGEKGAKAAIDEMIQGIEANPGKPELVVRLSLDHDHLARLSKGNGFQYVHNLITALTPYKDHPQLKFLIHTVEGDTTVESLLGELDIEERICHGCAMSASTVSKELKSVRLRNGLSFDIERSNLFASDTEANVQETGGIADHNIREFEDFLTKRRSGNMSVSFNRDGTKGVYQLLLYDGTIFTWGATAPDAEPSLYKHSHAEAHAMNIQDPLTLSILEKGTLHRDQLVGEVSPSAVRRAGGVGLRDFHARLLLEEDGVRLYATIRCLQEYKEEGRITGEEMERWPLQLQALVHSDPKELQEAFHGARRTIVHQYLDDPELTLDALTLLYSRLAKGQYDITQEEMFTLVSQSSIDKQLKLNFMMFAAGKADGETSPPLAILTE